MLSLKINIKKTTASILALLILYTLAGFFLVPYIANQKIVETINDLYNTESIIEDIDFNPFSFELEIKNLKIPDEAPNSYRLNLERIYVNLQIFPLLKKELRLKSLYIGNTNVDFKIFENELTNWTPKNKQSDTNSDVEPTDSKPWTLTLKEIELFNLNLNLSDFTRREALLLPIGPISLKAENISTTIGTKTDLESLSISLGNAGTLNLSGSSQLSPFLADVKFKAADIPINFLSSYLSEKTVLDISSGLYSGEGRILYQNGNIQIITNSNIVNFKLIQETTKDAVASWDTLQLNNLQIQTKPFKIRMTEVVMDGLVTGLVLNRNGRLNFQNLLREINKDATTEENSGSASITPPETLEKKSEPLDLVIDKISLINSKVFYNDQQIRPNFSAEISSLTGSIAPVTLALNQKISINLEGRIETQGKFRAIGYYRATNKKPELNLKVSFNNIEMTTFTPYSGKFAGYEISKGKLFLDLNYTLKNNLIRGTNKAMLDQFTLGKKVENDTASSLPIKLALALLKDRDGKIIINLPVEGDVDSPNFKMGSLIWTAIKNVITNIAAAPFDFLKKSLGDSPDIDSILFEAGTTNLLPDQDVKIQQLTNLLNERPLLNLEIQGRYLQIDSEALKIVTRKTEINEEQLKKLATERGEKIMSLFVEKKIDAERLFLISSINEDKPQIGARTLLILKNKD